jgi:site-specific DNA-methyltransferase (adenine-specific)
MPKPKWMLCWAKPGSCRRSSIGGFSEWEPILLYGKGWKIANDLKVLPDCVNHSNDAASGHPCPKPLKLMTWLLQHTTGLITDPFAGSGTTLLAAKQLERKAVGWELEESYCEIIANRLSQDVLPLASNDPDQRPAT